MAKKLSESNYCPIKNSECNIKPEIFATSSCFIAIPFRPEWKDTRKTISRLLKAYKVTPYVADEDVTTGRDILCKVCEKITNSDFGVMEISARNPNVMIEFGLTLGRRKPVFILYNKATGEPKSTIPVDITALDRIEYTDQDMLAERFEKGLKKYLQRLDVSRKRIMTLADLAKGMASDGKFRNAESIVVALSNVLRSSGKRDGLLIDVVASLYESSVSGTFTHLKHGGTLVRLLAEAGDHESAMKTFQNLNEITRESVILGYEKRDKIEKQIAKSNLRQAKIRLRRDWGGSSVMVIRDITWRARRRDEYTLETFFQQLWRLLLDLEKQKQILFLRHITDWVIRRLKHPSRMRFRDFWEDEVLYAIIFWFLNSPKLGVKELGTRIGVAKRGINKALPDYLSKASEHSLMTFHVR